MIKKKLLEDSGLLPLWIQNPQEENLQDDEVSFQDNLGAGQETMMMMMASTNQHDDTGTPQWESLKQQVSNCQLCRLCEQRTKTVFGVGDEGADILFVGEGPGAEEDKKGEPFVGQAGRLLDAIFASLGMSRSKGIYIANAVKCRPPENRKPFEDEMLACFPYLQQQIKWLSPKIIIALGATGAQTMLKTDTKIGALRGKVHHYDDIPLIATYHPAYLLRSPMEKAKVWTDMVFALRVLKEQGRKTPD